jgi:hypothetical protein
MVYTRSGLRTHCNCDDSFDIRCTCWINEGTWKQCPQKARTAYCAMCCHDWTLIEKQGIHNLQKYLMKKYKLNKQDWEKVITEYNEEHEQSTDEYDSDDSN